MINLITGFLITIVSLLIGFSLGKYQRIIPEDTQKKINQIFSRVVVPKSDVGAVERPTAEQNYYRDNPQARTEDEVMTDVIRDLNR